MPRELTPLTYDEADEIVHRLVGNDALSAEMAARLLLAVRDADAPSAAGASGGGRSAWLVSVEAREWLRMHLRLAPATSNCRRWLDEILAARPCRLRARSARAPVGSWSCSNHDRPASRVRLLSVRPSQVGGSLMLEYKGFRGRVDIDNGEDAFTGEVDGIRDVVTFEGRTPVEVKIAFRASVEDYLAMGGAAPVPPAAPAVPLKPVHWRRWAVIGPDGDCRRLCLTEGDACETACGDEEVQEVAVYPVDAPAPAVRWEDDETVKAARRAALQAIVDGLRAVGVAASVVGDGSTALDALCRAVAACGPPDAEPLPEVRAEDIEAVRELPYNLNAARDGGERHRRILAVLEAAQARQREGR